MPSKKAAPGYGVCPTESVLLGNFLSLNYSELVQQRVSCKKGSEEIPLLPQGYKLFC